MGTNMVEDKEILVNWAEMRQSLLRSAKKMAANLFKLRILYNKLDYYAQLEVLEDKMIITPDDMDIDTVLFFESHFQGAEPIVDEERKVFRLQFNFKNSRRSPIIAIVKDRDTLTRLESAVSKLFGASTDFDPNEITMEEEKKQSTNKIKITKS